MKKHAPIGKIALLVFNFILFYALLRLMISVSEEYEMIAIYYVTTIVYAAATAGLFIAFYVLNSFTFNKEPRTYEELPGRWTDEKKRDFMEKQPKRKEKAKNLIYFLLPLCVTLLVSFIELNFFA